jgi:hypothetical protein
VTRQAKVKAWGQPSASSVAVVLPGGPLYLLGHDPPAAEARYHRAVGPPEDQELWIEVHVVSGRQVQVQLSCSSSSSLVVRGWLLQGVGPMLDLAAF